MSSTVNICSVPVFALYKVLIRFGEQLLGEELFELGHFLAERAELRLEHAVLGLVLGFVWVHIVAVILYCCCCCGMTFRGSSPSCGVQ